MKDINEKILDAIKEEQSGNTIVESEANAIGLIKQSFTGTFRVTFIVVVTLQIIFFGIAVYFSYQLFDSEVTNAKIEYLVGAIAGILAFAVARLWLFMELNRLSLLREMKRMEMQIALLSEKLRV